MLRLTRTRARSARFLLAAAAVALLLPAGAGALTRSPIKQLQVRRLAEEPMRERQEKRERARERQRELRRLARQMRRDGSTTLHVGGESARPFVEDEDSRPGQPGPARASTPMSAGAVTGPPRANVRCNDIAGDGAVDGQCETAIVRWNGSMVAAWNDGTGFTDQTDQTQGWATSTDGGQTWVDHGKFPLPAAYSTWRWTSDPVLAVNPTTGAIYFSALGDASSSLSAVGVVKGRFTGSSFAWGPVSVARTTPANSDFLDKEWIAVDPAGGRVYLTYTEFLSTGAVDIKTQAADSALTAWLPPQTVSASGETGAVQGSRPIVSPDGSVNVVYYLIGTAEQDFYRVARSTDGGQTYSAPVTAVGLYSNFGTGAPGFDRPMGLQFPSIAVDRSGGPHNGRLYLGWAESMNWFGALGQVGNLGLKTEVELNDTPALATPLLVGQEASGSLNASSDIYDWYALTLGQGQSIVVAATALGPSLAITMRMFATDGATKLAYTTASPSDLTVGNPAWMFTAPAAGTYYLRVASLSGSGTYKVATGSATPAGERGRDQRDVFVNWSDDGGATWSTPVRVNNDPPGFDDWLPEVAVGADGLVYAAWYDWRDATASTSGGESSVYLSRSSDGGATWAELGATTDTKTAWTAVTSNIIPNQGDYLSLFSDASGLSVAWSDGRAGNPDVYMSFWSLAEVSTLPALLSATVASGRVDLLWKVGTPAGFAAELYRRTGDAATWDSLGTLRSAADGSLAYTDTHVVTGESYQYRLGVVQGGTEYFYGLTTVTVPRGLALAGAWPNPATASSVVVFTLPGDGGAKLDVLDIGGRIVSSRSLAFGAGTHNVLLSTGERLRPGVYFLRLEQAGNRLTRRFVVL